MNTRRHHPRRDRGAPRGTRVLGLDFDGTMVAHRYPAIGEELPLAVATVRELVARGWDVVLFTARSGAELSDAEAWCRARFPVLAVNTNPRWPAPGSKPAFDLVIDDVALGTPLTDEGFVDWHAVRGLLGL